jgi:beta-glucanase (GH16 family)
MKSPLKPASTCSILFAAVLLLAGFADNGVASPPVSGRWVPIPEMTDEFEGDRLDSGKWFDHYPKWDGRKPGYFSPKNVVLKDGKLQITARLEDLPNLPEGYHTFTTGAVRSRHMAHYGYFEIKAKVMRAKASSGFWFNEGSPGWWTEIDVFEVGPVGGGRERTIFTSAHVFRAPGLEKGFAQPGKWEAPVNLADDYHTYGLLWEWDRITFFFNGVVFREIENTHWHNPSHLNLNSEIKQTWFGLPDKEELPATFLIEYVRAWRRGGAEGAAN